MFDTTNREEVLDSLKGSFEPIPDGEYIFAIVDVQYYEANNANKTPALEFAFMVASPDSPYAKKTMKFQRLWLTQSQGAKNRMLQFMASCGYAGKYDPFIRNADGSVTYNAELTESIFIQDHYTFKGQVKTKVEEYNGKTRTKTEVAFFAPLTPGDFAALKAKWGVNMVPPFPNQAKGTADEMAEFSDEDLPF